MTDGGCQFRRGKDLTCLLYNTERKKKETKRREAKEQVAPHNQSDNTERKEKKRKVAK